MTSKSSTKFANLPEDCVAHVISLTTPRDACRFTIISALFRSAADSELVWDRFVSDHLPIISQFDAETQPQLLDVHSKKQLFMRLAESPIIIDGGLKASHAYFIRSPAQFSYSFGAYPFTYFVMHDDFGGQSFFVDKASGKKCFMISATEMVIVWGDTPEYWEWIPLPDSRFAKVAQLIEVYWLELSLRIQASLLSPNTTYTSYLVFKLKSDSKGIRYLPIKTSVGLTTGAKSTKSIFLAPPDGEIRDPRVVPLIYRRYINFAGGQAPSEVPSLNDVINGQYPKRRADGWMEAELGECFVGGGEDATELVEVLVNQTEWGHWKRGLVIQGIEFRPKS